MAKQQQAVENAPERLSVENTVDLLERLTAGDAVESGARLDLSAVASVDTAALQMLLVARRHLNGAGAALEWQDVSPVVADEARLLGLDELLALR